MADPFGLGMRALRDESQGTVDGLRRMIAKVAEEVHNLKEAHKRQGERLNSLIAAYEEGTRPVERSRCMPLRTIDLAYNGIDDDEAEVKAVAAEVAQNADQAQGSANAFIRKLADDEAKFKVRVAAASTASSGARKRVKLKRGSLLPLSTSYWMQRRRPCAGAVERMPLRTIPLNLKQGSLLPLAVPHTKPGSYQKPKLENH